MHTSLVLLLLLTPSILAQEPVPPAAVQEPPSDIPVVTLIDPGQEPRRELRVRPPADLEEVLEMSMDMSMRMAVDGKASPAMDVPPITMALPIRVTEVRPDGSILYEFHFAEAKMADEPPLPPGAAEAIRAALGPMIGLKGTCVVTDRGVTLEAKFDKPDELAPSVRQMLDSAAQSMRQMGAPLPVEPVGPGARWKTTTRTRMQGVTVDQVAEYELIESADDRAVLAIKISQHADPQKFTPPDAPAGMQAELVSLKSSGEGRTSLRLSRIVPDEAKVSVTTDLAIRVQAMELVNHVEMSTGMRSRAPSP